MSSIPTRPAASGGYVPALDGLRAAAVGVVLAGHMSPGWQFNAAEGVYVFFVLSGFLITGILLQEYRETGEVNYVNFYARRALRLLPPLILCLAVSTLLVVRLHPEYLPAAKIGVPSSLFYYSNWVRAFSSDPGIIGPFGHTWSLSIEEQFYLLWPVPLIWACRRSARFALALAVGLAVASLLCRVAMYELRVSDNRIYNGLDTNIEFLLAGCAVAILQPRSSGKHAVQVMVGMIAALVLLAQAPPLTRAWIDAVVAPELRVSVTTLAAAGLIYVLAAGVRIPLVSSLLEFAPIRWIGRISYGIYLYHILVLFLVPRLPDSVQNVLGVVHARNAFRIGLVLAVSAVSYVFVERPFLRLKSRFGSRSGRRPRPTPLVAAAPDGTP